MHLPDLNVASSIFHNLVLGIFIAALAFGFPCVVTYSTELDCQDLRETCIM